MDRKVVVALLTFAAMFSDWILLLLAFVRDFWAASYVSDLTATSGTYVYATFHSSFFVVYNSSLSYDAAAYSSCTESWCQRIAPGGAAEALAITSFCLSTITILSYLYLTYTRSFSKYPLLFLPNAVSFVLVLTAAIVWGAAGLSNVPNFIPLPSGLPQSLRGVGIVAGPSFDMIVACVFLEVLVAMATFASLQYFVPKSSRTPPPNASTV